MSWKTNCCCARKGREQWNKIARVSPSLYMEIWDQFVGTVTILFWSRVLIDLHFLFMHHYVQNNNLSRWILAVEMHSGVVIPLYAISQVRIEQCFASYNISCLDNPGEGVVLDRKKHFQNIYISKPVI